MGKPPQDEENQDSLDELARPRLTQQLDKVVDDKGDEYDIQRVGRPELPYQLEEGIPDGKHHIHVLFPFLLD